jgi:hypothetical protein
MTAPTALRRPAVSDRAQTFSHISFPLLVSCAVPILVALTSGGWLRLLASIASVGAGSALVADGVMGAPGLPAPYEPLSQDSGPGLEAAS